MVILRKQNKTNESLRTANNPRQPRRSRHLQKIKSAWSDFFLFIIRDFDIKYREFDMQFGSVSIIFEFVVIFLIPIQSK